MSYGPIELGRREIIIQKGEPTYIEVGSIRKKKEVKYENNRPIGSKHYIG
jgi:hypothetical protein